MRDKNSVRLEKVITYLEDERLNSRQKEIIQMLELYGEITIKALAERLKVSEMTIHRDVDSLMEQRYLYKKRGAVPICFQFRAAPQAHRLIY